MPLFRLTMPFFRKRSHVPPFPAKAVAPAGGRRVHRQEWPAPVWLVVLPRAARCVARRREAER
jgi:hypothetical protein